MEEKFETKKPYSWGPLYETLQEMIKNGDELPDEGLKKGFELFHSLDNAKSLREVRGIINKANLSREEQLRLNSPCLDGIIDSCRRFNPIVYITLETCLDTYIFHVENCSMARFIHLLCITGKYDKIKYLANTYSFVKENKFLFELMEEACKYMHYDIVNLLIDHINKIQPSNLSDIYGNAMSWILYKFPMYDKDTTITTVEKLIGYNEWSTLIYKLVDSGADLNANSSEPLRYACENNSIPMVKFLLERGAIKISASEEYSDEVQELLKK